MDVEHVLALYLEARVEREPVERGRYGALDGVLDWDDPPVGASSLDRLEDLGDRRTLDRLEIGDSEREQSLLRERPGWAEEGVSRHVRHAPVHSSVVAL